MKTKFPYLILLGIILLSCNSQNKEESEEMDNYAEEIDFQEGSDIEINNKTTNFKIGDSLYNFSSSEMALGEFALGDTPPTRREELEGMRTFYQTYSGKTNAGISVPGFGGLKLERKQSSLNLYFLETKKIIQNNDTVVYGIGYSVHYLFNKIKRGIDASNLASVAASAQLDNNKTSVLYSMRSYGVTSRDLAKFFKPQIDNNYDVDGFGFIQSNIDGIHNVLTDSLLSSKAKFTPEIIPFL